MNKILKEIIFALGSISLFIVIVLNLVFTTHISEYEVITYKINNVIYLIRISIY